MSLVSGLDIGRRHDRTALVTISGATIVGARQIIDLPLTQQGRELDVALRPCSLVVADSTGLGVGLCDQLAEAGLPVVQAVISARVSPQVLGDGVVRVGKRWLITRLNHALLNRELSASPFLPHKDEIKAEMLAMRAKMTRTGVIIEAAQGHDDWTLALALAVLARDLAAQGFAVPWRVCYEPPAPPEFGDVA